MILNQLESKLLAQSINNLKINVRLTPTTAQLFVDNPAYRVFFLHDRKGSLNLRDYYLSTFKKDSHARLERIYLFTIINQIKGLYNLQHERCHHCGKVLRDCDDLEITDSPTLRALKLKKAGNKIVNWAVHTGINRYYHFCGEECKHETERTIIKKPKNQFNYC